MSLPVSFRSYEIHGFGDCESMPILNDKTPMTVLEPSQVLVKVASAATNPVEVKMVENPEIGKFLLPHEPTASNPMRIGFDFAGTIVQVGSDVPNTLHVGDAVYGFALFNAMGSFAEYFAIDSKMIASKPKSLTFNEAAAVPAVASTSYQALVDAAKVQKDERVLILGGSGGTGGAAIQIAKALGAFVIATTSQRNVTLVQSLGADQVIDYTSENWAEVLAPGSIDVIYDCGVEPNAWNEGAQKVLTPHTGRLISIGMVLNPIESPIGATWQRVFVSTNTATLEQLTALIESGKLKVVIDSVFPFEQLGDALAKQKTKRARGKIVLVVDSQQKEQP